MSFVQLFPTHMLSLEFVLGFCHEIAKGGDCKVILINHSVGFRNPVFRWDSRKGSM